MTCDHIICPASASGMLDNPIRRLIQSPERIVGPYIHRGDTVLDIGCGSGYFTRPMARMVGDAGCVVAADLQKEMLGKLKDRAEREGILSRIHLHQTSPETLDLAREGPFNFILAFYVVHELPDARHFFGEVANILRPGGRILVVEPKFHVSAREFEEMRLVAQKAGLVQEISPRILLGHTMLLYKPA